MGFRSSYFRTLIYAKEIKRYLINTQPNDYTMSVSCQAAGRRSPSQLLIWSCGMEPVDSSLCREHESQMTLNNWMFTSNDLMKWNEPQIYFVHQYAAYLAKSVRTVRCTELGIFLWKTTVVADLLKFSGVRKRRLSGRHFQNNNLYTLISPKIRGI